mmetsp:Transcript_8601/g.21707  ORF Transcript_8601/g.21707 Transcript_8601/m.21707 type:complete len:389 (+) Transcript_8601:1568-2734(+)
MRASIALIASLPFASTSSRSLRDSSSRADTSCTSCRAAASWVSSSETWARRDAFSVSAAWMSSSRACTTPCSSVICSASCPLAAPSLSRLPLRLAMVASASSRLAFCMSDRCTCFSVSSFNFALSTTRRSFSLWRSEIIWSDLAALASSSAFSFFSLSTSVSTCCTLLIMVAPVSATSLFWKSMAGTAASRTCTGAAAEDSFSSTFLLMVSICFMMDVKLVDSAFMSASACSVSGVRIDSSWRIMGGGLCTLASAVSALSACASPGGVGAAAMEGGDTGRATGAAAAITGGDTGRATGSTGRAGRLAGGLAAAGAGDLKRSAAGWLSFLSCGSMGGGDGVLRDGSSSVSDASLLNFSMRATRRSFSRDCCESGIACWAGGTAAPFGLR